VRTAHPTNKFYPNETACRVRFTHREGCMKRTLLNPGGRIEAEQMPVLEEKPGNRDIAMAPGQLAGRAVGGGFFRHRKRYVIARR